MILLGDLKEFALRFIREIERHFGDDFSDATLYLIRKIEEDRATISEILNFYSIYTLEAIRSRLAYTSFGKGGSLTINILDSLRNIFLVLPIFVTWMSIWLISLNYQVVAELNPELRFDIFFLLGEKIPGLNTALLPYPILTLGDVSVVDGTIIAVVLILTVILQINQSRHERQQILVANRIMSLVMEFNQRLILENGVGVAGAGAGSIDGGVTRELTKELVDVSHAVSENTVALVRSLRVLHGETKKLSAHSEETNQLSRKIYELIEDTSKVVEASESSKELISRVGGLVSTYQKFMENGIKLAKNIEDSSTKFDGTVSVMRETLAQLIKMEAASLNLKNMISESFTEILNRLKRPQKVSVSSGIGDWINIISNVGQLILIGILFYWVIRIGVF